MTRCPKCPGINNCVPADGPEDSVCLFVGESPGPKEDKGKQVFIGPTGQEVDQNYLPLAGLRRPNVRIINAISCLPPGPKGKLDPKKREHLEILESCSKHFLIPEIQRNSYSLLVPMGAFACKALDPSINLELQHGIPCMTPYGQAFPMYHPAGGLHEPKKMLLIRNDWVRLRKYLAGRLHTPVDEFEGQEDYQLLQFADSVRRTLKANSKPIAIDTETAKDGTPFCLTYSTMAGTGFMIEASNTQALEELQCCLDSWDGPILLHNRLFDEAVLLRMGIKLPHKKVIDTMVKAFHLGNVPQGLKAIAYRELGMKMQDFDDLVRPHSTPLCIAYLRQASWQEWPKPEPEMYRDAEGKWKQKQPQGMGTKIKRFFTDYAKNPGKDVFEAWNNWENAQEMIQDKLGKWPGLCITQAPMDEVIHYACRDADATLRWYSRIKHMESRVRKTSQEYWSD